MKKIITTVVDESISWGALVGRLEMGAVMTALIDAHIDGFAVDNDFGGSGGWRIMFHTKYDKPDIVQMLGAMSMHVDIFEFKHS